MIMHSASDVQVSEAAPAEQPRVMMAPNFQPDDLDVPAFMRKRTDVM
jgi:hypothetical protein